jgi:hypothetical protein
MLDLHVSLKLIDAVERIFKNLSGHFFLSYDGLAI